jgi:hypothetical protein
MPLLAGQGFLRAKCSWPCHGGVPFREGSGDGNGNVKRMGVGRGIACLNLFVIDSTYCTADLA